MSQDELRVLGTSLEEDCVYDEANGFDPDTGIPLGTVLVDPREMVFYALGALVAMAFFYASGIVLHFPYTPSPAEVLPLRPFDSVAVYALLSLLSFSLFLYVQLRTGREVNFTEGVSSQLFALGLYLAPYSQLHLPFLVLSVLCGIAMSAWVFWESLSETSYAEILWQSCLYVLQCTALVFVFAFVGLLPVAVSSGIQQEGFMATMQENAELIDELFRTKSVSSMSYKQIAEYGQAIAHIEASNLGIEDYEPRVVVGFDGIASSRFSPSENKITIDAVNLRRMGGSSGSDLMECVAHEMAHAYQWAVVDLRVKAVGKSPLGRLSQEDIALWQEEFSSNVDSLRNVSDYWTQDVEKRARSYADLEMLRFAIYNNERS